MGHSAGPLLSCPSPSQVSIKGITIGMAAREGHCRKSSLGLPISQRKRITRGRGQSSHGEQGGALVQPSSVRCDTPVPSLSPPTTRDEPYSQDAVTRPAAAASLTQPSKDDQGDAMQPQTDEPTDPGDHTKPAAITTAAHHLSDKGSQHAHCNTANQGTFRTKYCTANDHNGVGVKTDGTSGRNNWHEYPRYTEAAPSITWQLNIHTRQPAPSEVPTGCNWASTIQQHSLRPPGTSMGNAAAYQEEPTYGTVATPEPSSHGSQLSAIHNAKNQSWNQQQSPPLTSGSSQKELGSTAVTLRDEDPLFWLGPCQDFNVGDCKGVISASAKGYGPLWCYKGWHRCAKVLSNGSPCGMPCHGAHRHHGTERLFA